MLDSVQAAISAVSLNKAVFLTVAWLLNVIQHCKFHLLFTHIYNIHWTKTRNTIHIWKDFKEKKIFSIERMRSKKKKYHKNKHTQKVKQLIFVRSFVYQSKLNQVRRGYTLDTRIQKRTIVWRKKNTNM